MNHVNQKPPAFVKWLLSKLTPPYMEIPLLCDMDEEYYFLRENIGLKEARRWYRVYGIKSIPKLVKNLIIWSFAMYKNYVKMAMRSIVKQKVYSFINICGLAIGMTCCTLILLFISDELSYDTYHEYADNIYRVVTDDNSGGSERLYALAQGPIGPALKDEFPEVAEYVRVFNPQMQNQNPILFKHDGEMFEDSGLLFADSSFFSVFTYEFISGNKRTALSKPNSLVITEDTANRIFGTGDPVGKIIAIGNPGNTMDAEVTAVIKNVPANSHFRFNYIVSFRIFPANDQAQRTTNWLTVTNYTYILTTKDLNIRTFTAKVNDLVEQKSGEISKQFGVELNPNIQKLTDIHLASNREFELEKNSEKTYVYIFSSIAAFILLIASINFMNLATARSAKRAREVGLRKVFGAYKKQLFGQFLGESLLNAFLGFVISILLVYGIMPFFNEMTGKSLSAMNVFSGQIIFWLVGMMVITGLMSGSYPAIFLSSFRPVSVLRGFLGSKKGFGLRRALVVFQFSVSVILIISTLTVLNQLEFMRVRNLGFDKEQIVVIKVKDTGVTSRNWRRVHSELTSIANVENVTFSNTIPGKKHSTTIFIPEGNEQSETVVMDVLMTDHNFAKTYGIDIIEGRDLSEDFTSDNLEGFLINETAAKIMGYTDGVTGKKLEMGVQGTRFYRSGKIVGVMKDFHTKSVKQKIDPFVVIIRSQSGRNVSVRLKTNDLSNTISALKSTWLKIEPNRAFDYFFLDDDFDKSYRAEERLGTIFTWFAGLAVIVACLGLFGLASFTIEQKTREIGIRKVLGASKTKIILLSSKEFIYWVICANLIACPTGWYMMNTWLESFAYKTPLESSIFAIAGFISLFVALGTISFYTISAARKNPVNSLRHV